MIEYGLSVSLETTPRTPSTPRPSVDTDDIELLSYAPRKPSFARLMEAQAEAETAEETAAESRLGISISPRVLFTTSVVERDGDGGGGGSERTRGIHHLRRNLNIVFEDSSQ